MAPLSNDYELKYFFSSFTRFRHSAVFYYFMKHFLAINSSLSHGHLSCVGPFNHINHTHTHTYTVPLFSISWNNLHITLYIIIIDCGYTWVNGNFLEEMLILP